MFRKIPAAAYMMLEAHIFIGLLIYFPRFIPDNLGNAYLTSFFATGAWDHSKLVRSLKAYQNAVSCISAILYS